jgi:hypothetical protein
VDLTLEAVNDAPEAENDEYEGEANESVSGNVLGNDSDVDGDLLSVTPQTLTMAAGTLELLANGDFTFTPAEMYTGTSTFEYTVTDGNGGSDTAQLTITIEPSSNVLTGTEGDDVLTGGSGDEMLYGLGGADLLDGGAGNDTLNYHADAVWPGGWGALNVGSVGVKGTREFISVRDYSRSFDVFNGGEGIDTLLMTDGNDALFLDDRYSDRPDGTSGPRISGIEVIDGGKGNDVIDLTSNKYDYGDVTLLGGEGDDVLWSSAGDDVLEGGVGADSLYGGAGADLLYGGAGDDVLQYQADAHWSWGWGALNAGSVGVEGTDQFVPVRGYARSYDVFEGGDGFDTITMTNGRDAIFLDDRYSDRPDGTSGPRISGVEVIDGGNGNDVIDLTSNLYDYGDVTLIGGNGRDTLWSSAGDDALYGGNGRDNLFAGAGNDVLDGGNGRDKLDGHDGDDILYGGRGSDFLYGGEGDDVLYGGKGRDFLYGEEGADRFVFDSASGPADRIKDFDVSEGDALDISEILEGYDPASDVISDFVRLNDRGGDTKLQVNSDGHGRGFASIAIIEGGVGEATVADLIEEGALIVDQSPVI